MQQPIWYKGHRWMHGFIRRPMYVNLGLLYTQAASVDAHDILNILACISILNMHFIALYVRFVKISLNFATVS